MGTTCEETLRRGRGEKENGDWREESEERVRRRRRSGLSVFSGTAEGRRRVRESEGEGREGSLEMRSKREGIQRQHGKRMERKKGKEGILMENSSRGRRVDEERDLRRKGFVEEEGERGCSGGL